MWPLAGVSLSHSGVVGACFPCSMGMVAWAFTPPTWRNSLRRLSVAPPEAASYYLSGLIRVDALDLKTNELCAAGFSAADVIDSALSSGIHYGVRNSEGRHYISVFAGSAAFDLCELNQSSTGVTWQVVAQLDADINGAGVDAVYGWYATNNAAVLTAAVEGYAQAWSDTNSIGTLRLTTRAEGRDGTISDKSSRIYFDEVRLGTNLTDVTTILPDPVIVYRQAFYKDGGNAPITDYGWTAHYGSEATPFFPVPAGYNYYAQPYVSGIHAEGYMLDNLPGTGDRAASLSGSAPKLVWTALSGAASADVVRLTSITFELAREAGVRVAVQVDGGTSWYLSQTTFVPVGARELDFTSASWDAFTFDPGVAMSVGGATTLPKTGKITALGFYYQISGAQDLQLDTVAVKIGPPPQPPSGTVILVL